MKTEVVEQTKANVCESCSCTDNALPSADCGSKRYSHFANNCDA